MGKFEALREKYNEVELFYEGKGLGDLLDTIRSCQYLAGEDKAVACNQASEIFSLAEAVFEGGDVTEEQAEAISYILSAMEALVGNAGTHMGALVGRKRYEPFDQKLRDALPTVQIGYIDADGDEATYSL